MQDLQAEAQEIIIEMAAFIERYVVTTESQNLLAKANILLEQLAMKEGA